MIRQIQKSKNINKIDISNIDKLFYSKYVDIISNKKLLVIIDALDNVKLTTSELYGLVSKFFNDKNDLNYHIRKLRDYKLIISNSLIKHGMVSKDGSYNLHFLMPNRLDDAIKLIKIYKKYYT